MEDLIYTIVEQSSYDEDHIQQITEYNAKQYEVQMYDAIKETRYFLDINLYEMTLCEIDPKSRKRWSYETINLEKR
jgi:hypothetical protein